MVMKRLPKAHCRCKERMITDEEKLVWVRDECSKMRLAPRVFDQPVFLIQEV